MSPRKHTVDAAKGVLEIEWPFFGELSRGLALRVARAYDPEIVIGIATAGVIPGAVAKWRRSLVSYSPRSRSAGRLLSVPRCRQGPLYGRGFVPMYFAALWTPHRRDSL